MAVDADIPIDPRGTVDWIGSYLGVAALILFNFVWKYVVEVHYYIQKNLTFSHPSTTCWMEQSLRDRTSPGVCPSFCRLRILGNESRQGTNSTIQHLEGPLIRTFDVDRFLFLHEPGYLLLVHECIYAKHSRRQSHSYWCAVLATYYRWLCNRFSRSVAGSSSISTGHNWLGMFGNGHYQRPSFNYSCKSHLLGDGISRNVHIGFYH